MKLSQPQRDCLRAVRDAETVVLQHHGRVIGRGEFLKFMPETFLRLIGLGLIEFCEPLRMRVTPVGAIEAEKGRPMMPRDEGQEES